MSFIKVQQGCAVTEAAANRLGKVSKAGDCHKSKTTLCLGCFVHCPAVGLTIITFFHTVFIYHVRLF